MGHGSRELFLCNGMDFIGLRFDEQKRSTVYGVYGVYDLRALTNQIINEMICWLLDGHVSKIRLRERI